MLCHKMHIPFFYVEKDRYHCKLINLLSNNDNDFDKKTEINDFNDEMLIFVNLAETQINTLLNAINRAKVPVALKAVLTEHNSNLNSYEIFWEISDEHQAMLKSHRPLH